MAEAVALAVKVIELMSQPPAAGTLYVVDARLRSDGEKGVLASSLEAHADYYRQRGELWERQALMKARFVAVYDAATQGGRQVYARLMGEPAA